jgi:ABC transporter substrate binding protein
MRQNPGKVRRRLPGGTGMNEMMEVLEEHTLERVVRFGCSEASDEEVERAPIRLITRITPEHPLITANRIRINTLALRAHMPAMYSNREFVEVGGLMSYGPNITDLFRRAAEIVDKVLRGAKPADIPIEQPTKFDLVVNLVTAKALGLEIPTTLLARADGVIE